jgi:hypothetical protein
VFVTGFWDPKTRQRVNVNRASEQLTSERSQILKQWPSERAVAANARYDALVREAAQGPLLAFYEIHSNHQPAYENSIQVSTQGVRAEEAKRFRAALLARIDHLAPEIPRLAVHVSPLDRVTFPNYANTTSVSRFSRKGCAIEHPARVYGHRELCAAYANCLAEAIEADGWT